MFSGIVDHMGRLKVVTSTPTSKVLEIETEFKDLALGESIAVDGVCLTVTGFSRGSFRCDVSPETCAVTRFCEASEGDVVNLERSLRVGDRNGGHHVTGHVDGVVGVESAQRQGDYLELCIGGVPESHRPFLTKKGSIALNGVSLTVNEVSQSGLSVLLIPHTRESTNIGQISKGCRLNVEYDWMTKVIVQQVERTLKEQHAPV